MKGSSLTHHLLVLLYAFASFMLSACAHSAGSYDPISPIKNGITLAQYANLSITANNDNSVSMTGYDRERLLNKIIRKLQVAHTFKTINAVSSEANTLIATLQITEYDQGNAFLRFMLAGLGQIHIDGNLTLTDRDKTEQIGKYELSKTFAWGGIYGMSTRIEDVEEGFAEAVVEILQEKDRKPDGT